MEAAEDRAVLLMVQPTVVLETVAALVVVSWVVLVGLGVVVVGFRVILVAFDVVVVSFGVAEVAVTHKKLNIRID